MRSSGSTPRSRRESGKCPPARRSSSSCVAKPDSTAIVVTPLASARSRATTGSARAPSARSSDGICRQGRPTHGVNRSSAGKRGAPNCARRVAPRPCVRRDRTRRGHRGRARRPLRESYGDRLVEIRTFRRRHASQECNQSMSGDVRAYSFVCHCRHCDGREPTTMKTASESRSGKRIRIEEPSRARLVPRRPTSSIRPSTSERFTTQRAPRTATPTTIPTRKRLSRLGYREQPSDPFGDRVVAGEAYSSTRERVADGINGTRQRQQRSLPDPGVRQPVRRRSRTDPPPAAPETARRRGRGRKL